MGLCYSIVLIMLFFINVLLFHETGVNIARKVLEIHYEKNIPGSIQIRMGGVKGMLTVRTDFPPDKVGIRPSMCKFQSNHRMIEVKRVAVAKSQVDEDFEPKLFNQILLIMHHLGVSQESKYGWISLPSCFPSLFYLLDASFFSISISNNPFLSFVPPSKPFLTYNVKHALKWR